MHLGDILVAHGLVKATDVERGLQRQRDRGGRLGDHLVALGIISAEELARVLTTAPAAPNSVRETDIPMNSLLGLLLKLMQTRGFDRPSQLAEELKLSIVVTTELMQAAGDRKLVESLGVVESNGYQEKRFQMTEAGRRRAADALQLAAAFVAAENRPSALEVVTLDDRLAEAAGKEGFVVGPE